MAYNDILQKNGSLEMSLLMIMSGREEIEDDLVDYHMKEFSSRFDTLLFQYPYKFVNMSKDNYYNERKKKGIESYKEVYEAKCFQSFDNSFKETVKMLQGKNIEIIIYRPTS